MQESQQTFFDHVGFAAEALLMLNGGVWNPDVTATKLQAYVYDPEPPVTIGFGEPDEKTVAHGELLSTNPLTLLALTASDAKKLFHAPPAPIHMPRMDFHTPPAPMFHPSVPFHAPPDPILAGIKSSHYASR